MGAFVHDTLPVYATNGDAEASSIVDLSKLDVAVDDWVRLQVTEDGGGSTITPTGGNITTWTEITTQTNNSGSRLAIFIGKVTSLPLTSVTVSGATDDRIVLTCCIRGADTTTPVSISSQTNQTSATTTLTAPSIDTTSYSQSDVLVLHSFGFDNNANSRPVPPFSGQIDILKYYDSTGALESYCVKRVQRSAGATGTFIWERSTADGGALFSEAWKGDGTTTNTEHSFTGAFTYIDEFGPVFTGAFSDIQGLITTYLTETVDTATSVSTTNNINNDSQDYGRVSQASVSPTSGNPVWLGAYYTLGATQDLDGKLVYINLGVGTGAWTNSGPHIVFFDTSGNWESFKLADEAQIVSNQMYPYLYNYSTTTPTDSSGTIDWTSIDRVGFLQRKNSTSTGSRVFIVADFGTLSDAVFVGGGAGHPVTPRTMVSALRSGGTTGRVGTLGTGMQTSTYTVQVGDGTIPTYFVGAPQTMEWPAIVADNFFYTAKANTQGMKFYPSSSDTIDLRSMVITSDQEQNYTWNVSASASATVLATAHTVQGMLVELLAGETYTGMSVLECAEIVAHSSILNNCNISNTTSTAAAITFDANSSMSGTEIDVTGTAAAYHLSLGTSVTAFTLIDCIFTGTPGTDKIHVKATTGTVTITDSGSGLVIGDITSDGATIVLDNSTIVTVKVTVKTLSGSVIENAQVYLEADSGGVLPAQDTVTITRSGSVATVTHTAHGLSTSGQVAIRNAVEPEYNGIKTITVTGPNSYTFTISGTPATPATGTIDSTAVILNALSDVSGIVQDTNFPVSGSQPVRGTTRKASAAPLYIASPISGTITASGFDQTIFLASDE